MPDLRVGSSTLALCVVESTAAIEVTVCTVGFTSIVIYEQRLPVILVWRKGHQIEDGDKDGVDLYKRRIVTFIEV